MKLAFGLVAHSGWAALVVIGGDGREFVVTDRRRIELAQEGWARQPYHAAPWGKDQKNAAIAAMIALERSERHFDRKATLKF